MNVPLLDLQPQMTRFREEILQAVTDLIDSTRYILGPRVTELEQEIADYCGVPSSVGVSSGTDALLVSLMALEIGQGDLVLTTTALATLGHHEFRGNFRELDQLMERALMLYREGDQVTERSVRRALGKR